MGLQQETIKDSSTEQVRLSDPNITFAYCRSFLIAFLVVVFQAGKAKRFSDPGCGEASFEVLAQLLVALSPEFIRATLGVCANGLLDRAQGTIFIHHSVYSS